MICDRCGKIKLVSDPMSYGGEIEFCPWNEQNNVDEWQSNFVCLSCYKDFVAYWERGNVIS